jgi:hypothetical protein
VRLGRAPEPRPRLSPIAGLRRLHTRRRPACFDSIITLGGPSLCLQHILVVSARWLFALEELGGVAVDG